MAKKCFCGHEMTAQDYRERWVCYRCGRTKPYEKPMTNHEWIKSLSPKEYAEEFRDRSLCEYLSLRTLWCKSRESCENCCVEWLQSEQE